MSIKLSNDKFNEYLEELSEEYIIYAPVRIKGGGRFSDTDSIRYKEISKVEEIEYEEKSEHPAKEAFLPVTEVTFNIIDEELIEPKVSEKKRLVFLRACDLHAIKRLDTIYLKNGNFEDPYYKQKRENAKFVLMGCKESYENCFCVSMGTNKAEDYNLGIEFLDGEINLEVRDEEFKNFFEGEEIDFTPAYVEENNHKVRTPNIEDINLKELSTDEMWRDYDRCIGCGRCTVSCPTCTCFTTTDIYYDENGRNGERRRVWASCHVDKFTDMAGGHSYRQKHGDRMRFKTMHKVYDFQKRFGENMCVGCGRCDDRCPEYISFANCINRVTDKVSKEER